ncbi:MAG: hypothetical protein Q9203_007573, partial [Teloschistes exilis]
HDPIILLKHAQTADIKTFWKWAVDSYNRITVAASLRVYWRVLRMHALDKADRVFDEREKRDIHNYLDHLIDEYSLRKIPKRKPVIDLDDLYHLLYTHWVLDDSVFKDERQRVQLAKGLLAAAFFDCRPCSLFDTRVNLTETSTIDSPDGQGKVRLKTGAGNTDIYISQRNRPSGTHSHQDYSATTDSDSDPCYISDSDSGTDDDYDTGPEETRSFLYRHIKIHIVANPTPGQPNLVFLKAMLLHTKGQDRNPRV